MDHIVKDHFTTFADGGLPLIATRVGDSTLKEFMEDDCITSGSGKFIFDRY